MWKQNYRVVCAYDTETTTIGDGVLSRAFPVLFICNDLRDTKIAEYDSSCDDVRFYRNVPEMLAYLQDLIQWGITNDTVPVVCAYNLMFDLQPLLHELALRYRMAANAQTASSVYTLDLIAPEQGDGKNDTTVLLRFWDTFYLEQNGLAAMGETCGLAKAKGDWDYTLTRTPETPLSDLELHYARRDVQVIPEYLKWLLKANAWLDESMFGCTVLTKTSLVRQMAKRELGARRFRLSSGKTETLSRAFELTCKQEFPRTYRAYALRKACFRGGLTFTAAKTASVVVDNVASLDVTSMHHAFINGRRLPVGFRFVNKEILRIVCDRILKKSLDDVLYWYDNPFKLGLHAAIRFDNIRLRKDSCFQDWGIAICPRSKFAKTTTTDTDYSRNDSAVEQENNIRANGHIDSAVNPTFAFGKLYAADSVVLNLNEIELWNIGQVYDFDSFDVLYGEATTKTIVPPDYVTLQSNLLFERKTDVKNLIKGYSRGVPYEGDIPGSIPDGIADDARSGALSDKFLAAYYQSTVKGQFNGIYGTQAQDILKPSYLVDGNGMLSVDHDTVCTPDNFNEKIPKKPKVLYTYGMRIVAGSRMHLVIAMELLYRALGNRVDVTGGDTDSLKIRCDPDVTDADLLQALKPLHDAIEQSIDSTMRRVREVFPDLASPLTHIGKFEVEDCGGTTRYARHMELWNKARVSLDHSNRTHITCAGLPRPDNMYTAESFIDSFVSRGVDFAVVAPLALGYNVLVDYSICHTLMRTQPDVTDWYKGAVTDYTGATAYVESPESVALYPSGRWLGETGKQSNYENMCYLERAYNRHVMRISRELVYENGTPMIVGIDGKVLLR